MTKIRKNSHLYNLLEYLLGKGSVYKQDVMSYALELCYGEKTSASKLVNELIKRGLATYSDFEVGKRRREKKDVKVIRITEQAIKSMCKLKNTSPTQYLKLSAQFNSHSHEKLYHLYNENHLKTLFDLADIETDKQNKPSLAKLHAFINQYTYTPKDENETDISNDDMHDLYKKGIYYTDTEYKEFFNDVIGGGEVITSIFRGLFLSADKCLVVYSNGKNNNRMLYLKNESSETILMQHLKALGFANTRTVSNGNDKIKVGLSALLVSEANSFIYSTAIGRKNGRINKYHPKDMKTKSIVFSGNTTFVQDGQAGDVYYNYVYAVVYDKSGIKSIKYLTSHTTEEHIKVSQTLADNNSKLSKRNNATFPLNYEFRNMQYPCIYMPVYEIKTLNTISDLNYVPVIITRKEMTDVIQHCTHKTHIFVDIETLNAIPSTHTITYDDKGYPKGKKLLEEYLHERGKTITLQQFKDLPKMYNMEYIEFYNQVATGMITCEDIEQIVETKPYNPVQYYREKKERVYIPKSMYQQMKQYAQEHNITLYTTAIRFFSPPQE